MIVYGISTCDMTKKALKELAAVGIDATFRDIRAEPLSTAEIATIITEFGDLAVNKQSTTYRGFSDFLKASEAEAQIAAQPTVMKRPAIQNGADWYLGWDDKVRSKLIG